MNSDSNWRPGIPSPDLNNPEHTRMLLAEHHGVDGEDLATSKTITRGVQMDGVFSHEETHALADGTAGIHHVLHHLSPHDVGNFWHGHHHSIEDAKIYAEADHEDHPIHMTDYEPDEDEHGNKGYGGRVPVVLEAHRPKGWDPNKNPDDGLMGNSYLAHPTTLRLHKIHFQAPDGNWHGIDATGHTVHATGESGGADEHSNGQPYPDYEGADHHRKTAGELGKMRGPGWRVCPSCGGVGDTDDGGECQRCDGSGYLGRHEATLISTAEWSRVWDRVRAEHESVHRGFGMVLSEDDHEAVHDQSRPLRHRAEHLLRLASMGNQGFGREHESGMGTHWSTDANVAHHFAKQDAREQMKHDWSRDGEAHGYDGDIERHRPETRVVLHAHFPSDEHIDEAHGRSSGAFGYDEENDTWPVNHPGRYEREVPVAKGAPMRVHAISFGLASHMSDAEAPHDRETHRYDFPDEQYHTAARKQAAELSPEHFGMQVEHNAPNFFPEETEAHEITLHPDHPLIATQRHLDPDHPALHHFDHAKADKPQLVEMDGEHYVSDGHHTIAGARRAGVSIPATLHVSSDMEHYGAKTKPYPPRDHREGGVPFRRIFGPTHGLDVRLFDHDVLKAPIRDDLMRKWHEFCEVFGLYDPDDWSIVYFAGSEASEWTSAQRKGNNDFDVLVGVSVPLFLSGPYAHHRESRAAALGWELTPERIAAGITEKLRSTPGMVTTSYRLPGNLDDGSDFDQTWYVNPGSYHIADIKPYAAYDVTHDTWAVKPPHLPGWSMKSFPEGPALEDYCWGMEELTRATLDMPEPYRHQEGFALWHFVHDTRSEAFGPQGEGWYDPRNVVEKWLDQKGLMQHLWTLMREAVDNPHLLDSPADWSNTPVMAMLVHSALVTG